MAGGGGGRPEPVERLIDEFSRLPGIGRRSAERLAFHVLKTPAEEALRLSPKDPHLWTFLHVRALAHYQAGNLEAAETNEREAILQHNHTHWPYLILLAVYGRRREQAKATELAARLFKMCPNYSLSDAKREVRFGAINTNTDEFMAYFIRDLRSAGIPA